MSSADRPDARHRILGLALQLAAYAPVRKNRYAYEVRVPWRLIIELRQALSDAGVDWRAARVVLRKTDE
jgi:hypothetical protein